MYQKNLVLSIPAGDNDENIEVYSAYKGQPIRSVSNIGNLSIHCLYNL